MLIDFFGAQRDIQERVIRVLHNLSFVEDPTRVFRAIRFELRLGFHIARHTENLIKNAVKMNFLEKLGGKRLLTELVLILREKEPLRAVERLADLGLLRFIHPDLHLAADNRRLLAETQQIVSWFDLLFLERSYEKWAVYFLALCDPLSFGQFWGTCTRLSVGEHYKEKLSEMRQKAWEVLEIMETRMARRGVVERSAIHAWLRGLPVEVLLYMMAKTGSEKVKKAISLYFTQLQGVRTLITGEDLKRMGVPPGPLFAKILADVLSARLNNRVQSREDELRLVGELLRKV